MQNDLTNKLSAHDIKLNQLEWFSDVLLAFEADKEAGADYVNTVSKFYEIPAEDVMQMDFSEYLDKTSNVHRIINEFFNAENTQFKGGEHIEVGNDVFICPKAFLKDTSVQAYYARQTYQDMYAREAIARSTQIALDLAVFLKKENQSKLLTEDEINKIAYNIHTNMSIITAISLIFFLMKETENSVGSTQVLRELIQVRKLEQVLKTIRSSTAY